MAVIDFKEYTRMRDIAVKRSKRLTAAGLAPAIHIPTVREIRSGVTSGPEALRQLDIYLSSGSTVKAARQTGIVPEFKKFPELPPKPKLTEREKKQRKREQSQKYRQLQKIKAAAKTKKEEKQLLQAFKAVRTIENIYKSRGMSSKLGIILADMTPTEAAAFIDYINYRFSQGDFTQIYVIDEFTQDYNKLKKKGYSASDIKRDFNKFLENRKGLSDRSDNMEGIDSQELRKYWDEFTGD